MPVPERARPRNRLTLHIGLFVLTLITATLAGAESYASFISEFGRRTVTLDRGLILGGLWYSGTFLAILGAPFSGHSDEPAPRFRASRWQARSQDVDTSISSITSRH